MFRTYNKKGYWYLDRNLAVKVSDDPLIVKLTFTPKGNGHVGEPYFLQEMKNKCVICGTENNLNKHHVVPRCYRKFFPTELKQHKSFDVLPLCTDCHHNYELKALTLKQELGIQYKINISGEGIKHDKAHGRAISAAKAILEHKDRIPEQRLKELYIRVEQHLKKKPEMEDLIILSDSDPRSFKGYVHHGCRVMEQVEDIDVFVQRWRQHFVKTMQPKYLPDYWMDEVWK